MPLVETSRETKVSELDMASFVQKDVVRLDVPDVRISMSPPNTYIYAKIRVMPMEIR